MSRPRTRRYLDELNYVALADLRPILGRPGSSATVQWANGARLRIEVEETNLAFEYAPRHGTAVAFVEERAALERYPQPLGGVRMYVICPACGARARKLYVVAGRLRCRRCAGRSYFSQSLAREHRLARKHHRLRERIAPDARQLAPGVVPPRPSGMRWRRYRRLERKAAAAWQRRQAIVLAQIRLALVALRASIGAPRADSLDTTTSPAAPGEGAPATLPAGPVLRTEEPR